MLDYAALEALSAVLSCGSFEAAAGRLGVTPAAVSLRIKTLEERMGAVLVIRGQPCRGTEAGRRLAAHLETVRLLEADLAPQAQLPALRIALNADSLATWVLPALAEVAETEGRLFDLVIDDQDHSADWLRRGEVMGAITASATPVPGCDVIRLGALRYLATASPGFVARWFPDGVTASALERAPALVFNEKDRLQADWAAQIAGRRVVLPAHRIASSTAFLEAARLGLGWGMNPDALAGRAIAGGYLVPLAPEPLEVPLFWQVQHRLRAPLAGLTRALRRAAQKGLWQI